MFRKLVRIFLSFMVLACLATPSILYPETLLADAPIIFSTPATSSNTSYYNTNSTYADARDATSGGVVGLGILSVGQDYSGSNYSVFRSYLYFDTSSIPTNATIISANLSLEVEFDYSYEDFNIVVQCGNATAPSTYPHDPFVVSDFDQSLYSGDGGVLNTANLTMYEYNTLPLNATGIGFINIGGTTKLCLRNSNDINDVTPTTFELVHFAGTGAFFQPTQYPLLVITYVVGSLPYGIVSTNLATNLAPTSATLQGTLYAMIGSFTSCYFEYGTTASYGTSTSPQTLTTNGTFSTPISGLFYGATYHFKAVATYGTLYYFGSDLTFTTLPVSGSSTDIQIKDVAVFSNYVNSTANDILFCVETICTYTSLYPSQTAGDFFQIQLVETDNSTVLAASSLSDWGDRPSSIYLRPSLAASLVVQRAYIIKLVGYNISGVPTVCHTLTVSEWKGTDLGKLDRWCLGTAMHMATTDGVSQFTYRTVLADGREVLSDAIGGYFITGIPGIGQIRPYLFATYILNATPTPGTASNVYGNKTIWETFVGAAIANDVKIFGTPFSLNGRDAAAGMIFLAIIGVMLLITNGLNGAGAVGAFFIAIPILWLGTYFQINDYQLLTAICLIAFEVFAAVFLIPRM